VRAVAALTLAGPLAVLWACGSSVTPLESCAAVGDAEPLCGWQNPEDLALLPSGAALLVSEYGRMDRGDPGAISRLDLRTGERTPLFESGDAGGPEDGWGDPACASPPQPFSPHGLHLVRRDDGRFALWVVNHGERESVEVFEVGNPHGRAVLTWRGCVTAPEGAWWNDVVGLADGGFLVSHMMPRREGMAQTWELVKAAVFGAKSGHVLSWSEDAGFARVAGSEASFANGIEISPDGRILYVNENLGDRVFGVELETGQRVGEAEVVSPDNLTWARDGRLLVASLTAPVGELLACGELEHGACPAAFRIVALDPESFETQVVYVGDGETMGAGTVGLQAGDDLYVGTFAGDRILRVRGGAEVIP
jgi:sugar lactone lactonase YvrE